jgi:hypothetical protein
MTRPKMEATLLSTKEQTRCVFAVASLTLLLLLIGRGYAYAQTLHFSPAARQVVESRLKQYGGKNPDREAVLKELFAAAGCDATHLSEQTVKGSKLPNVVCILPGDTEKTIIVGAHFDRVSEGDGVVDNWSGASLLPSLYEAVKTEPRKHKYIFVGFTDEERGEIGSSYYASKMTKDEVSLTDAMVNMDTLGLAPVSVWASHSDKHLTGLFAGMANQFGIKVTGVNVEQIGTTDSEPFRLRKIASITLHSLTQESYNAQILHTKKDNMAAMHLDDYYQAYRLIAAYLVLLDERAGAGKG